MASLHPTEHRGFRELFAFSRSLSKHWDQLAQRLPASRGRPFRDGAEAARELIAQLEVHAAAYGVHSKPAAQGMGLSIGLTRASVRNRFLEVNQVARFALSEIAYLVGLLAYLKRVAQTRQDTRARDFCAGWLERFEGIERQARSSAAELGADPDLAVEPYDRSALGKAGQSVGFAFGTVGEWVDRKVGR